MGSLDAVTLRVLLLAGLLGHSGWPARQAAHRFLAADPLALRFLDHFPRLGDPEAERRRLLLVHEYRRDCAWRLAKSYHPAGWKHPPWIALCRLTGSCTEEDRQLRDYCLRRAMKTTPSTPPQWEAYREATRLYIYEMLMAGKMDPFDMQGLLEELAEQERQWVREHGRPYGLKVPP